MTLIQAKRTPTYTSRKEWDSNTERTALDVEEAQPFQHHHYVYLLYGEDDTLLYVGMTRDVRRRIAQHRKSSPWWDEVVRAEAEAYPDRQVAAHREGWLIRIRDPIRNRRGRIADADLT